MRVDGSQGVQGGYHVSVDGDGGVRFSGDEEHLIRSVEVALDGDVLRADNFDGNNLVAEEVCTAAVRRSVEGVVADGDGNRLIRVDDSSKRVLTCCRGCCPPAPRFTGVKGDGEGDVLRVPDDGFSRGDFNGGVVLGGHNVKTCR